MFHSVMPRNAYSMELNRMSKKLYQCTNIIILTNKHECINVKNSIMSIKFTNVENIMIDKMISMSKKKVQKLTNFAIISKKLYRL